VQFPLIAFHIIHIVPVPHEIARKIGFARFQRMAKPADDFLRRFGGPQNMHGFAKGAADHGADIAEGAVLRTLVHGKDAHVLINHIDAKGASVDKFDENIVLAVCMLDDLLQPFIGIVARRNTEQ